MSLLSGSGAPSNALGVADDFYIDNTNQRLYGPKTTVWGSFITLGPVASVVSSKAKTQRINLRRDTKARWMNENPILSAGEPGYVTDTGELKVGNGISDFLHLNAITGSVTAGDGNIDGGFAGSIYGGTTPVDGGGA